MWAASDGGGSSPLCNCFLRILLLVLLLRTVLVFAVCFCIVRWRFCFTRPASGIAAFSICSCWMLRLLPAAVSYLYPVANGSSHTHTHTYTYTYFALTVAFMSIGARPFPFHFRYCKSFRIKYIFLSAFVSFRGPASRPSWPSRPSSPLVFLVLVVFAL